jgi:hypothetical protein
MRSRGEADLRKIALKYRGRCLKCGGWIPVGETACWEQGRGVWHVGCHEGGQEAKQRTRVYPEPAPQWRVDKFTRTPVQAAGAHVSSTSIRAGPSHRKFARTAWKLKAPKSPVLITMFVACAMAGLLSLGYSSSMGPIAAPRQVTSTNTACIQSTATIQTFLTSVATSTTAYSTQGTTWITQTIGKVGPCPYGGTYFASIYTRLCGWQYNVCVSFDRNCGNDYTAVYSYRTTIQIVRATVTCTSYLSWTTTQTLNIRSNTTSCGATTITETTTVELPNPSKSGVGAMGLLLFVIGVSGSSYGVWANQGRRKFHN